MADTDRWIAPASRGIIDWAMESVMKAAVISELETVSPPPVHLDTPRIDNDLGGGSALEDMPYDIRRLVYLECLAPFVLEAIALHLPKAEREQRAFQDGWQNVIRWEGKAVYLNLITTSKWLKTEVEHLMWESTILYLSNINLIWQRLDFVPSIWSNIRCVFVDGSLLPHFWKVQSSLRSLREVCIAAMDTELPNLEWNPQTQWSPSLPPQIPSHYRQRHHVPVSWRLGELLFLENGEIRSEQIDVYIAFRAYFDTRSAMRGRDDMAKLLDIKQGLAHFVIDVEKLEVRLEGEATRRKVQRVLLA